MDELAKQTPGEFTSLLLSFSDINLVTSLFEQQGWSFTDEIREVLFIARQNNNLATKLSAIKYLRVLIKEIAETAGYVTKVTQTIPGENGESTTFSAKRVSAALNPPPQVKKIISTQKENLDVEEREQETLDRGSTGKSIRECPCGDVEGRGGDAGSGGSECPREGGELDIGTPAGETIGGNNSEHPEVSEEAEVSYSGKSPDSGNPSKSGVPDVSTPVLEDGDEEPDGNSCVEHRPPTCKRDLYPGISSVPKE